MKMSDISTKSCVCAGIDVGNASLAYALADRESSSQCANTLEGRAQMIAFFKSENVTRIGLESTASYHFEAAEELRAEGFEVHILQPRQVKAYAAFKLQRAKSDPVDAGSSNARPPATRRARRRTLA